MLKTTFSSKGRLALLLSLAGLLSLSTPTLRADDDTDKADPPSRVARISYTDGSVSLQPGGTGDWGAAQRNRPMTIGDKIWSDKDSRAELETGVVSIHLGSMTALSFLNLDENITQMRLAEGSINFRVREMREGDTYEVDTPNASFVVKQAGAFRIDVNENGDNTGVTIIRGAGQVIASGQTYDLEAGQRGIFNGTDNVEGQVAQAPPADGLDQWANDRDLRAQDSVSSRYVSPDMPGTEDLDNNGTWSEEPDYGNVWYPNEVEPDWAPYSYGYWSYVGPWGWTWVDYAPWGFAPFHYGRWAFIGGRWGWCPGPIIGPAVYGPAFVGFLGGGFGFGVGFGVGWFPLGWGEPFHPWFHCGPRFVERINVRNTFFRGGFVAERARNFNNFAFAHNTRAVTVTSRSSFTGGQMIRRGTFHVNEANLRNAQVSNRVNFSPSRGSSFGAANLRGNISRPPSRVENRAVMARTAPNAAASHLNVRTMNNNSLRAGTFTSGTSGNRPNGSVGAGNNGRQWNGSADRPSGGRAGNNPRTWEAQGNTSDRGRAPQGFGSDRPAGNANTAGRVNRTDRPPWAGSGPSVNNRVNNQMVNRGSTSYSGRGNSAYSGGGNRSYSDRPGNSTNPGGNRSYTDRPGYSTNPGGNRSYTPPQRGSENYGASPRSYSPPARSYSPPSRSYSPPPSRSYSAPAPRTYSAPSRSYGGGGSYHGGGGGGGSAPRGGGGGGGSRGGGGGGGRPHGHG